MYDTCKLSHKKAKLFLAKQWTILAGNLKNDNLGNKKYILSTMTNII